MSGKVVVNSERCKGCSLCISVCPRKILDLGKNPNAKGYYTIEVKEEDKCTACTFCALICPDTAIEVYKID